jgi:hypothetical protein
MVGGTVVTDVGIVAAATAVTVAAGRRHLLD